MKWEHIRSGRLALFMSSIIWSDGTPSEKKRKLSIYAICEVVICGDTLSNPQMSHKNL